MFNFYTNKVLGEKKQPYHKLDCKFSKKPNRKK